MKTSTLAVNTFTYPLAPGAHGRSVSHAVALQEFVSWPPGFPRPPTVNATITTTEDYIARDFEQVTVPAGTFRTLPVDSWANATVQGGRFLYIPDGNRTRTYYSAATGMEVKVVDYDGQGWEVDEEVLVEYRYVAPLAGSIGGDIRSGMAPLTVHLNATASEGLPPYSFTWRFGDNTSASGASVSHTYRSAGRYNVTVTVRDLSGQALERSLNISVSPRPWYASSPFSDPPFWAAIAGTIAAVALGTTLAIRRRRRIPPPPPREAPPPQPPAAPSGEEPRAEGGAAPQGEEGPSEGPPGPRG